MSVSAPPEGQQPFFTALWVLALVISLSIPGGFFGWTVWNERLDALRGAEATALRTVAALQEHGLRVFEAKHLLLDQIDDALAGRDWGSIETDARLHRRLADLAARLDGLDAVALIDAQGVIRLSSRKFPAANISAARRDYFHAHQRNEAGLLIGSQIASLFSNERILTVSKRRSTSDGGFDGVIVASVPVAHFSSFWQQFAPTVAHVIPMIRADGELLVRYPAENNPQRLSPDGPFMQQVRRAPERGIYTARSQVDGVERLNAYSRLGNYPVYVSFSIETQAILREWREGLVPYAAFTAMAILALLGMTFFLLWFSRHHQNAADKWRQAANRLQAEMDRREAAEERLRQAQKMETIGHITGGVAHDFNNLLQVLANNLALADRTTTDAAPKSFIKGASDAVERAAHLTRQLLAFSRRQPLDPRPIDVVHLVHDMSGLLLTTLGATIKLKLESEADVRFAMTDRHQAEMAILNLAVNARDAMPQGGTLTIRISNVRVDEARADLNPGDYVAISVVDTGTGMSPEVLQKASEPFFTTKRTGKGSGLGLSQVHGFAAQSGGGMQIKSEPGHGTTVTFLLPAASRAQAIEPEPSVPESAGQGSRHAVLLVDDDDLVRTGIAANLAAFGYEVLEAAGGGQALEVLRQRKIDLLVTDYAMPGMNGSELIRLARARLPALKALLITGFADLPAREEKDMELLRKPFKPDEIAARIRDVLQGPAGANVASLVRRRAARVENRRGA